MKKISLFFDGSVTSALKRDWTWSTEYLVALDFFSKFIAFVTDPRMITDTPKTDVVIYHKEFVDLADIHHLDVDADDVRKMFGAYRVEGYLRFQFDYKGSFNLELKVYRRGEKKSYSKVNLRFLSQRKQTAS